MKRIYLLLTLLPALCFSQNFQTVQPNVEIYFEPDSGIYVPLDFINMNSLFERTIALRALRLTVTDTAGEWIYLKNFSEIHDEGYIIYHEFENCVSPTKPSWIGNQVLIKDNGFNVFFNRQNDSIFINTQAQLNESFVFYNYPDGSYFLATIGAEEIISFLGISDTAKTIILQLYTSDNQPATSLLNEKELIISKNYGFYKTLNFRDFPEFGTWTFQVREHILYGHENIVEGFKKMALKDIYDFEVGDEYHYKKDFSTEDFSWSQQTIRHVLNKEWISDDVVKYQFHKEEWGYEGPVPYYEFYHTIDTVFEIFSDLDSIISEALPFEPYTLNYNFPRISFNIIKTDDYNYRPALGITDNGYEQYNSDTCYYRWWFDSGTLSSNVYVKGCGMLENYYSFDYPTEYAYYSNLLYFKKPNEEWGIPLTPPTIRIQENALSEKVILFPNPASDILNINFDKQLKIKTIAICNPAGQLVIQKQSPINSIDISSLQAGLYFVEIVTEQGSVRKKLVVE